MIGHTVIGQLAGYARDRIKILREKPIDQINIPVEKRLYLRILAIVREKKVTIPQIGRELCAQTWFKFGYYNQLCERRILI